MADTSLRADSVRANPIARRDMLAAALLGGAVFAAPAIAAAATDSTPAWEDPVIASRRIDVAFWELHSRERRLHRHWIASFERMRGSPRHDEVTGNWCARHSLAETAVILARVSTLPALYAKMETIRAAEMDCELQLGSGLSVHDVLLFDIERMMKAEYRVSKNG